MAKPKPKEQKKQGQNGKKNSWLKDTLIIVVTALALALLLKAFIVDSRVVPSSSMHPTIQISDRVVVSKLSYIFDRSPQRGDIVVFDPPAELNEKYDLIKRVIGLPGDTVEVYGGLVYINDEPLLNESYILEQPAYQFGPVTVPEGHYLMLGDNRNGSNDGHVWLDPFVPETDIKGKAICRYWPLDRIGALYEDTAD